MNTIKNLLDEAQELVIAHRVDHAISKLIEALRALTTETSETPNPVVEKPKAKDKAKAETPSPTPPKAAGTRSGDISSSPNGTIISG